MCEHAPNREAAMVITHRDATGKPTVWCDPCIAPIVRALNDGGLPTIASCCGHHGGVGRITLADGRELFLVPDFEAASAAHDLLLTRPLPPADPAPARVPSEEG